MRGDRPASEPRDYWLRPSGKTQYVRVTCPPVSMLGHWDGRLRRSRRCGGPLCALCALGWTPVSYWYIGVLTEDGLPLVLELRSRHSSLREDLSSLGWDCVGTVLGIRKEGQAKNSPVAIVPCGKQPTEKQDISAFVAQLGLPSMWVAEVEVEPSRRIGGAG